MAEPREPGSHDALLTWCSECGSGSWGSFLDASRALGLSPSRSARALSALGHVEFDWQGPRFACAPATMTTIPAMPGRFLLAGQRVGGFLEQFRERIDRGGIDADLPLRAAPQAEGGPGSIVFEVDPRQAHSLAELGDLAFAPEAALAIAARLPALSLEGAGEPIAPDERFPHCRVDPESLEDRWDSGAGPGYAEGLWAWRTLRRHRAFYLRRDGQWWHLPVREHGPYLLKRVPDAPPLLSYDAANRILVVAGRAPLPELHERAATLCSGRMALRQPYAPGFHDLHYVNVPAEVAERIIASLTPNGQ